MKSILSLGLGCSLFWGCLNSNSADSSSKLSSSSGSSSSTALSSNEGSLSSSSMSSSSTPLSYAVIHSDLPALQRVVGYIPLHRSADSVIMNPAFEVVTHVNLSFLNPDDSTATFAKLKADERWQRNISALRTKQGPKLKLMASIGGAEAPASLAGLIKADKRSIYVDSLIAFMESEKLDGIDIDLEGSLVADTANYNAFVRLLSDKVHAKNKLVTAAVAGWQLSSYSSSALKALDFINLMSYDYTGPWAPKGVGPHSSLSRAMIDINNFAAKEGVGKDRITLGVPFYAHQFYTLNNVKKGSSIRFKELLEKYPEALETDSVGTRGTEEGIYFYNGRITMRDKTIKAREYGGIMIWELGQDATGEQSLLKVIADHAKP